MQSLFPQQGRAGAARPTNTLIDFKCGKCNISELKANGKHDVTPDETARGKISLTKEQDGLVHFRWTNTVNGRVEDDRIVLPGEYVFKKVNTGRPDDRVYVLKYLSGDQKLMYWMQDKSNEKDEHNAKQLNDLMSNPNAASLSGMASSSGNIGVNGVVSQADWMNLINNSSSSNSNSSSSSAQSQGLFDFSDVLATMPNPSNIPPAPGASSAPPAAPSGGLTMADYQRALQQSVAPPTPALQDVLASDAVVNTNVLNDQAVAADLVQHLPEGQQTGEHLEATIRSPQFRQALSSLTNAVAQPENYQSVMSNFGINPEPGSLQLASGDGVGAFLTSLTACNPPVHGTGDTITPPAPPSMAEEKEAEEGQEGETKTDEGKKNEE